MRRTLRGLLAASALLPALALAAPAASAASPTPAPSASGTAAPATKAGTSFLTAVNLSPGQDANVAASTGDYLYWAFGAAEGQTPTVSVTVNLAPAADRHGHGPQTWAVEVFDGLRRRQACTAGTQNATGDENTASLALSCTLREVRTWAEPWSGDPLPGTYYVKLAATDVAQQDLGLAASVQLHTAAKGDADNAQPEGGELKAPLVPPAGGGASTAKAAAPVKAADHWYTGWFSGWNSRWYWTIGGGALAAVAGVLGFHLTRHPRGRRPGRYGSVPPQAGAHQHGAYTDTQRP